LGIGEVHYPTGVGAAFYYHANLIGSTRFRTESTPLKVGAALYTAFGEVFSGASYRYGYAGAHGYQADVDSGSPGDFPFMHVGARYYDPVIGRFLQRDPIGIEGGLNVYEYVR
ncbi:MAG: hypothetical protein JSU63_08880, partial [Phycisphaerales bacterium]